jgi:aldehyde dehydrogenase
MHLSASLTAHLRTIERKIPLHARYENFIGGKWIAPVKGGYFDNISPTTGQVICQIARSQAEDVELALDAAHAAADKWGRTAVAERARALNRIADRIEEYLPFLAAVETYDNGKPIRETNLADLPLAVDHFRYFASCVRAQEGSLGELDDDTVAYHFHEPLGVVAQIIPWNFPILMAVWKLAPALAAGNAVVLKPAEQTPLSIMVLVELIQDLLPPGVLNVVNGFGLGGWQAARIESTDQQGRLYRGDHHRAADHAIRLRKHHSRHARTWRQVPEYFLRRCAARG